MFRKAQLRLFAVITSILLAIFIAVLSSINILTKTFMQRQSREVLQQIASGMEYNEKTDTFTFTPPEGFEPKHIDEPPPEKFTQNTIITTEPTAEETTAQETSEEQTTETPEETKPEVTEEETEPPEADEPEPEEETPQETESPEETEPDTPPEEVRTFQENTQPVPPEDNPPPEDWHDDDRPQDFPPDDERRPEDFPRDEEHDKFGHWWNYHDWDYYSEDKEPENIRQQSCTDRNYTVSLLANTVMTQPAYSYEKKMFKDDMKKDGELIPKSFGSIDFFVLMADKDGNYLAVLNNDDLDSENAQSYITEILSQKNVTGMADSYQFYNVEKNNGTLIALTDKSEETKVMKQFIRTTLIIGSITLIVLSFAGYFLSKKSIEPIKSAFEKQKQFISDASHELKTPLTVISANADVLSGEIGENKWLNYIKSQTDRMNLLVNDLLNLTRLENNTSNFICTEFNLSQAVTNTALPFECRAFETNKKFIVDIEDGLTVNGSEQHIKQMTAIFIDNALKYSNDGGMVRVNLKKQGDKKILSVYNTGSGVKEEEKDKIFERFYRSDSSRTHQSAGGYGLGLAIAKSIIDKHKFKITVENTEGKSICFVITM